MSSGFQAVVDGVESLVSPTRFISGVSVLAVGLIVGVVQTMLENAEGRVSAVGGTCPVCGRETERMKRKKFHRMLFGVHGTEAHPASLWCVPLDRPLGEVLK